MAQPLTINIIAAVADNGVIGSSGDLPWRLPEDLRHFKEKTMGHPIIMGRKTWDSLKAPLPGRRNIILSKTMQGEGVYPSLEEALKTCSGIVFIIGGAEIYNQALPLANRLFITRVHCHPPGDTYFPEINPVKWKKVSQQARKSLTGLSYTLEEYVPSPTKEQE